MTRYEAYIGKDWQSIGLAQVLMTRLRDDGTADYSIFLVDVFCLGVKEAFGEAVLTEQELRETIALHLPEEAREPIHPTCAKKLTEGAVAYAEGLGFAPHRDFRKARKILSGLDASLCPTEFTYGQNGKPCYVRGSQDDEKRVDAILARLEARCGADGYTYLDQVDEAGGHNLAMRQELREWLDQEPESVPRFYETSGIITGLLLGPETVNVFEAIQPLLWGPVGRTWRDQQEAKEFFDRLGAYWNYVNTVILDCVARNAPPELHPVDVGPEEFEEEDGFMLVAALHAWAKGFMRATQVHPEAWADAFVRPDLARHWELVRCWAELEKNKNFAAVKAASEEAPSRTLASSVAALARALRQPMY